jgi:acetyl-CoA decarbonylase/synthase complex subunit gamma
MAKLTGLMIQKLLPNTNCKECGSNTCMAFAMKLAAKKAELSACPYASEEAKRVIGAASEPPVKGIELGPNKELKVGEETVLYRHEKTFVHQPVIAVNISDTDPPAVVEEKLKAIKSYSITRAGVESHIDMVGVSFSGSDDKKYIALVQQVWNTVQRPLVLRCTDPDVLISAAHTIKGSRSIMASATPETAMKLKPIAQECGHALVITGISFDAISQTTDALKKEQFDNIILDFQPKSVAEAFLYNTIARRAALKDNYKPLGYPSIHFLTGDNIFAESATAMTEISKYGGFLVLPAFDAAQLTVLLAQRMAIYTDPQKPIQVDPNLYPIGEPTKDSRVFVTTNFSLTFFIVSGEIENSGVSAWLVVPDAEGMSVLTAWAAGKFNARTISKFMKEISIDDKVTTREIIIPGFVSQISGELEDALPGWKVLVGPQDAADIEGYVKALKP